MLAFSPGIFFLEFQRRGPLLPLGLLREWDVNLELQRSSCPQKEKDCLRKRTAQRNTGPRDGTVTSRRCLRSWIELSLKLYTSRAFMHLPISLGVCK